MLRTDRTKSGRGIRDIEPVPTLVHDRASLASMAAGVGVPDDLDIDAALDEADCATANALDIVS